MARDEIRQIDIIQDFKRRLDSLERAIKSSSLNWWNCSPDDIPGDTSSGNGMREVIDELWQFGREIETLRELFEALHPELAKNPTMRAPSVSHDTPSESGPSLGEQIRAKRQELFPHPKVKTEDFAKSVGADKSTLLKWEAGEQIPRDDNARKLAELLKWPELLALCEVARLSRDGSRDPMAKKI